MMRQRQRGAALLLLVAVLGLGAASLLINAFSRNTAEAERQQRTLATLAQAREALLGFAATNGRLPRPAASALDGRERPVDCLADADILTAPQWRQRPAWKRSLSGIARLADSFL